MGMEASSWKNPLGIYDSKAWAAECNGVGAKSRRSAAGHVASITATLTQSQRERDMRRRFFGIGLACLGILALAADEAGDEQKAVEAIRKAGGTVQVDADEP